MPAPHCDEWLVCCRPDVCYSVLRLMKMTLSHCRLNPTSPSPELPEFPLQRGTPSRTRGNFSVGKSDVSTSAIPKQRRSRGSFPRSPSPSIPCDSFIDSLRKYPLTPGRSASTELVQRLLNYTQAKHISKNNPRSTRSLINPRQSHDKHKKSNKFCNKPSKIINKASKNIQTYTRIVNELPVKERQVKRKRNKKNAGVDNVIKSSLLLDQLNETYNYAKSSKSLRRSYNGRGSEVRYLNDMKRFIKDTIKQIVDGTEPIPCNKARSRYMEHKRLHHRSDSATSPLQNESAEAQTKISDDQLSEHYDYLKPSACHKSCYTGKCGRSNYDGQCSEILLDNVRKYIRDTVRQMVDCTPSCPKTSSICRYKKDLERLSDDVSRSFQKQEEECNNSEDKADADINCNDLCPGPRKSSTGVCPNVMSRYRLHRRKFHEDIKNDDENEEAVSPDSCYPPSGTERSFFSFRPPCVCDKRQTIFDSEDIDRVESRGRYNSDDDESEDESDTDIEEQVIAWLTQLPIYLNNTEENKAIILEMVQDLIAKLNDLKDSPDNDDRAMEEIQVFLDQLPVPIEEGRGKMGRDVDQEEDPYSEEENLEELTDIVSRWIDCLDMAPRDKKDQTKLVNTFVNKLQPMIEKNVKPEEFKAKILGLIPKSKDNMGGTYDDEVSQHVDDLVSELHYMGLRRHEKKHKKIREKFLEPILKWLTESTDIPEDLKEKHEESASKADAKLQQMLANNADDVTMEKEIDNFFDSIHAIKLSPRQRSQLSQNFIKELKCKPHPMDDEEKEQIAKDLLQSIKSKPYKKKLKSKQPLLDWLENNPYIPEKEKGKNRISVIQFDKKLQQMRSQNIGSDVIETEINNFLDTLSDKGIPLSPGQKIAAARKIKKETKSMTTEITRQPVSDWLANAPNITEKVKLKNKTLAKNFDQKIQHMVSKNVDEDIILDEINEFLDSLPEKGMPLTPNQKKEITRNILKVMSPTPSTQPALDWLENATNIPEQVKQKNRNLVKDFDEKLQQMKSQSVEDNFIEDEISKFFDMLPGKDIPLSPKQKSKIVRNILKVLKSTPTQDSKTPASNWLENATNIPEHLKQKHRNFVNNFDKKIQQMKADNVDQDVIQDKISEFLDTLSTKDIALAPKEKRELTKNMLKEVSDTSKISKQPTSDWLENATNITEQVKQKNRSLIKNFDEKLKKMESQNVNDDVIQTEISDFLDSLSRKGIPLSHKQKNGIVRNIFKDLKTTPTKKKAQLASDWVEKVPNIPKRVKEKSRNLINNFDKKLEQMKAKNVDEKVIKDEINEFVDSLSEKGMKLTPKQKGELTKTMLKGESKSDQINKQPTTDWFENAIYIPEHVKQNNRNLINTFDKKLQQMKSQNVDDDTIEEKTHEFLNSLSDKGMPLTLRQKKQIAKNILRELNSTPSMTSMQPNEMNDEDVIQHGINEHGISLKPKQKSEISRKGIKFSPNVHPALDWLETNIPEQVKQKARNLVIDFDDKLQQMKSQNVDNDLIEDEISEFIDSLSKKGISLSPREKNELAKNILEELKSTSSEVRLSPASDWLENASNIPKQVKEKNRNLLSNFDRKIQQMKAKNVDKDILEDEINEFIDSLSKKGIKLTYHDKDDLSKKILEGETKADQINKHPTTDWFEKSTSIPEYVKQKNRNLVKNFDKKINQMKFQNVDDETIEDQISNFLDTLSKKGVPFSSQQKSEISRNIFNELKPTYEKKQPASEWLENASNISKQVKEKNKNFINNFDNKIQQMKAKNVDEGVIKDEVNDFVDSLTEKGIKLTPQDKAEFTKNVLKGETKTSQISKQPAADWFQNDVNIPQHVKQKNRYLVQEFDEKLQQMKFQHVNDGLIEDEISKFLDSLSSKSIALSSNQKSQIARNILKELKSTPVKGCVQSASGWLENASNIPKQIKEKNKNTISNFDKKIQQMKADNVDKDIIQDVVDEFLDSLPRKGILLTPEQKTELTSNILNEVDDTKELSKPSTSYRLEKTDSNESASEWVESATNTPKEVKRKNRNFVKKFDQQLKQLKSDKASDNVIENQIRDFLGVLPDKRTSVPPKDKNRLTKKKSLFNVIKDSPNTNIRPVSDWLEETTNVPKKLKNINYDLVESFDDKLYRLRTGNATDDAIEAEINDFLDILTTKGIGMSPVEKAQLARKFMMESKLMLSISSDSLDSTSNVLDRMKNENRDVFKNLDERLKELLANNVDDDVMEDEIRKFVDSLAAKGIILTPEEKEKMVQDLLNDAKSKHRKHVNENVFQEKIKTGIADNITEPEMREAVKDEVSHILGKYDIPPEYADEIEKSIANALADQLLRGVSDSELEKTLMSLLKNANVSEEEAKRITDELIKKNREMSASYRTLDSTPTASTGQILPLSPREKQELNEIVHNKILDFIEEITGDDDPEKRDERKQATTPLASNITEIMSDLKNKNKDARILHDIEKYFEEEPVNTNIPNDELAKQLKEKLDMIDFRTSTPHKGKGGRFFDKKDSDLSAIDYNTSDDARRKLQNKKLQSDIENTLSKWFGVTEILSPANKNKLKDKTPKLAEDIKRTMQSNKDANLFDSIYDALSPWVRSVDKDINEDNLLQMTKEIELALNQQGVTESSFMLPENSRLKLSTNAAQQEQIVRLLNMPDKFIKEAVDEWAKSITLPNADKDIVVKAKQDLVKTLTNAFVSYGGQLPLANEDKIFKDSVAQFLVNIPEHSYISDDINTLANSLKGLFKESAKKYAQARPLESAVKKGSDILLNDILDWVEKLPIESDTPEDKANSEKIKQEINNNLIHKIGELNMNPEIFNDDFFYEDVLDDEVDKLLKNTRSENVKKQLPNLKKTFLDIIRKARQKIRDENAGQAYKQQLREAVTSTLPLFEFSSPDGRASFNILKDDVADTFINMHYVGNDPNEINKLKNKINDEIYKFCMKYLKRCPATPIDTRRLNEDLYKALKSIPEPHSESFRDEVELVKIKEIINNWVTDLPLRQQSSLKKLQTNKMVSFLAKKLHDIENEREYNIPSTEYDDKIKKEILKFINKLPLTMNRDEDFDRFAENLIQKLKNTEQSRRLNASTRHSIDSRSCLRTCYRPPPCTLSKDDLDHLEKIRMRCGVRRKISFKDVSISPFSADTASQTDFRNSSLKCPGPSPCIDRKSSSVQTFCRRMQAVGSQVSPNVIVNEHHWNSADDSCMPQTSCGVPMPRRIPCSPSARQRNRSPITTSCTPRPVCTSRHSQFSNPRACQIRTGGSQDQINESSQPDYQPCCKPSSCRVEQNENSQARVQCSPNPRMLYHRSSQNFPQRRSSRDDQSYPFDLASQTPLTNEEQSCQSPALSQRTTCEILAQRNLREGQPSRYKACDPYLESRLPEERRSSQVNQSQPMSRGPCLAPCPLSKPGPSYPSPQGSDLFSSSQELPCFNRRPCFITSSTPPVSSEDYGPHPGCSFQNRVTHLGSFDHVDRLCMPRFPQWGKQPAFEYWESDGNPCNVVDEYHRGKRCRCKPKCGKFRGRRKPGHLANDETMSSCAKCCGVHCPFPSYMFFR